MTVKFSYVWALVGASVVLLGVLSLQLTTAAWRSSDTTPGAQIRTGHLRIGGEGDVDLDVTGLAKENMNTGDRVQMPLTVVNDSTGAVAYRIRDVTVRAGSAPPALDLRIARVAEAAECPADDVRGLPGRQLYDGDITGATTAATTLAENAADVLCLTATARTVEPGESGRFLFTFDAEQL